MNPEILDRQPPCDTDAERGVLCSIILLPEVMDDLAGDLSVADFYDAAHGTIYRHILEIYNEGTPIDPLLLIDRLRAADQLEKVGDTAYLAEIFQSVATAANAVYYAKIVREKAILRSLIHAGVNMVQNSYQSDADAQEAAAAAEQAVLAICEQRVSSETRSIGELLGDAIERLEQRMTHDGVVRGISTGFTKLDELIGGLMDSTVVIIAARPAMGKTAFALSLAANVAIHDHKPVMFASLEMSEDELTDRLLCAEAEVNGHRMRCGTTGKVEQKRILKVCNQITSAPLFINADPGQSMTQIAASARRLKRRKGLRLIVVDYLQLIEPDSHNRRRNRQEEVATIARRLKRMARELEVPVVCLAQLNRDVESTSDHRPRLSHLRESGAIEQDADVVMFLHRPAYWEKTAEKQEKLKGVAEVIVAKQRSGPTGVVKLVWREEFMQFANAAPDPQGDMF